MPTGSSTGCMACKPSSTTCCLSSVGDPRVSKSGTCEDARGNTRSKQPFIIKTGSKGPVFFRQERIGLRGRKFKLYKFRTMVVDAEEQLKLLKERNEADGPVFKIKDDPRITRVGKFLRKTGLDELPQLFNVIRGEMSLVGPRPPLEEEVKQYERWQLRRLSVKPGLTCTWQIVPNRHDVSFEEWMELDLHYIDTWNLGKDVELFFKTVRTFFLAGGH